MSEELELEMQEPESIERSRLRSLPGAATRGFFHWLPLALALGLFAQIGILGLRPALEEREFLQHQAAEVHERNAALHERFDQLTLEVEAWQDPVYLERVRRWRAAQDER